MGASPRIPLIVVFTLLTACRHAPRDQQLTFASNDSDPVGADAEESQESDSTDVLNQDIASEDLCKDDVYATYLISEYRRLNPSSNVKGRGARQAKTDQEVGALFYARSRLLGSMDSYYGSLPVVSNPMVEYWIRYFKKNGRNTFLTWLIRAESVRKTVEPLLRQEGLPIELFFLGMIESGYSNTAYSRARATGSWQFMHGTAKLYGLRINHWVDERRDPVKSTVAAARFLKDLYVRFGDWYLAMAAYNAGPGKISRAIRATGSRDFWKIAETRHIHAETRHYVPKMLAALQIASNPASHGFNYVPDSYHDMPDSLVELSRPVQLAELAQHLDIAESTLRRWNPELINSITPPEKFLDGIAYQLRLPSSHVPTFTKISTRLSYLEIRDVKMYQIKAGDTLSTIARRHGVRMNQIISVNQSLNPRALRVGRTIAIPIPSVVVVKKQDGDTA